MAELTYAQALNKALEDELAADPSVFLLGEDIGVHGGVFGVTRGLMQKFGEERVRDTPISESAFMGLAIGAAMTGMRPVVEIMYIDFILVAADQLMNQAAKARYMSGGQVSVPLVVRAQQGGGRGNGAQHSQSLDALFAHTPGLKVVMPSNASDAYGLLRASIRDANPVVFLEHKLLYPTKGEISGQPIPLGVAEVKRAGTDVTVVALSRSVQHAMAAAEELAKDGVSVEVIDPRTVRPLDLDTILRSVRKTNRLVLVHEAVGFASVVSEIAASVQELAFDELDAPIVRVTGADAPVACAEPLESAQLPSPARIIEAVKKVTYAR